MEVKDFTFEMKASDERTIEGLGSVFGNVDGGNDVVMPGAFSKTLKARSPAMLWQHKSDHVLGVWDDVRETPEGLYVKGRILETTLGNDAYTLAKHGAIRGMSIGYATKDSAFDRKTGVRQLKELDLWEVSLVTFPMNEAAGITSVKSDVVDLVEQTLSLCRVGGANPDYLAVKLQAALDILARPEGPGDGKSAPDNERDFEEFLREAGYAREAAKIITARGFKGLTGQREAEGQIHERLLNFINSLKS